MKPCIEPIVLAACALAVRRYGNAVGVVVPEPSGNDVASVTHYWQAAEAALGEDFAARIALHLPIGAFGPISYAAASAADLGSSIELVTEMLPKFGPGMSIRTIALSATTVEVLIASDSTATIPPSFEELLVVVICSHFAILERPPSLSAVFLRRAAPVVNQAWRDLFSITPSFSANRTALQMAVGDLAIPMRTASSQVRHMLQPTPSETNGASMAERVLHFLKSQSLHTAKNVSDVASALDLSPRTLQRQLTSEATSLRELQSKARIDAAQVLLDRTATPLTEIAQLVGFSGTAAFSRAFAAQTGVAPSRYKSRAKRNT